MKGNTSKICPYCAEQINATAKACPHCRLWLSPFSLRNVSFFGVVAIFCLAAMTIGMMVKLNRMLDPGRDFGPYRGSLSIVESRMNLQDVEKESSVNVVTIITNKSEIAWKQIQLEIRFFDKTGTLVDARTFKDDTVVYPHSDTAFRAT